MRLIKPWFLYVLPIAIRNLKAKKKDTKLKILSLNNLKIFNSKIV